MRPQKPGNTSTRLLRVNLPSITAIVGRITPKLAIFKPDDGIMEILVVDERGESHVAKFAFDEIEARLRPYDGQVR